MTEGADYVTLAVCQVCDTVLGEIIDPGREGRAWLRVGGLELYAAHGRCCGCGGEWHWTASEVMLKKLVDRAKKSR